MTEEEKAAAFDAAIVKLVQCKSIVETIQSEISGAKVPDFVLARLHDAKIRYEEAKADYEELCDEL
jgi:hypothetical protein